MGGLTPPGQPPAEASKEQGIVTKRVPGKRRVDAQHPIKARQMGGKTTASDQLRIEVPVELAEAVRQFPKRTRSDAFMAAVFGELGTTHSPLDFLSAVAQLEKSEIILRQSLHLGLSGGIAKLARTAANWIARVCGPCPDSYISLRFRLPSERTDSLIALKPRSRSEFVRLVMSCSRADISLPKLVSDQYRLRAANDCIVWNLMGKFDEVPVAEIVALLDAIDELRDGGTP